MSWFVDLINALSCRNLYKYVLNDCTCHSECSDCFECDMDTSEVEETPKHFHPSHTKVNIGGLVEYESDENI
jgi:hypothetical protein